MLRILSNDRLANDPFGVDDDVRGEGVNPERSLNGSLGVSILVPIQASFAKWRKCPRPIILPLSNPTSKSEAIPEDVLHWTDGRALIATGSPFLDVHYQGRKMRIAQCNNVYIFPAMGLALLATRARRVTDRMFLAAARALAAQSPAAADPSAPLLPALTGLRQAAVEIAFAAAEQAQREGLAPKTAPEVLRNAIIAAQWAPHYPSYL